MDASSPAPSRYVEVAVDAPTPHHSTFTYAILPGLDVEVGQAVWVPFGPRLLQGIVFEITPTPQVDAPKLIASAVSGQPSLSPWQIDLARWISRYYDSSLFKAAALMMPPGFERRTLTLVRAAPAAFGRNLDALTPRQRRMLRHLERYGVRELDDLKRRLSDRNAGSAVDQLVLKGLALREQQVQRPKVGPKLTTLLRVTEPLPDLAVLDRSPRQAELVTRLEQAGGLLPRSSVREAGFTAAVASGLVQKGIARWEQVRSLRDPLSHIAAQFSLPFTLTPAQAAAVAALREALDRHEGVSGQRTFLLHGVTGSGKTEVYLQVLAHAVALERKAIVLVPEIALTPQTVGRFAARFPGRVAVLHSALSAGEQFDEWWRIYDGEFDVVIGSRSAVFAPQPDLGLIVVDEEHEAAYKQADPAPRYHARRVAEELARRTGAVLVLGSATPDLGSYAQARVGRMTLLELPDRAGPVQNAVEGLVLSPGVTRRGESTVNEVDFPTRRPSVLSPQPSVLRGPRLADVTVVDLRKELQEGNRSIFSRALTQELETTLEQGRQAILFLNRRGTSTFVQCRDCGHAMACRRCDLALTYHSATERLLCHQCNARTAVPTICPQCSSPRIKFLGIGTQRVEDEVKRLCPEARVLRWDRDTARTRHAHEAVLRRFQSHDADILVGTQMIAKGLDLPQVTLVGVINADVNLYLPDFRAAERTFQLLTQVAGRAGRGAWAGTVIIQTYTPEHYAITAAAQQNYRLFFDQEVTYRRRHGYPPFGRMARLVFAHPNSAHAQHEAESLAGRLRDTAATVGIAAVDVIGPVPAYPPRLRGRYRWQIILLGGEPHNLLERTVLPRGWIVDVDPVGLG